MGIKHVFNATRPTGASDIYVHVYIYLSRYIFYASHECKAERDPGFGTLAISMASKARI